MNKKSHNEVLFEAKMNNHGSNTNFPFHFICFIPKQEDLENKPDCYFELNEETKSFNMKLDIRKWFEMLSAGDFHAIESLFPADLIQCSLFYKSIQSQREEVLHNFGANIYSNYIYRYFENIYYHFQYLLSRYEKNPTSHLLSSAYSSCTRMNQLLERVEQIACNAFPSFNKKYPFETQLNELIDQIKKSQKTEVNSYINPQKLKELLLQKRNYLLLYAQHFEKLKPDPKFLNKLKDEFPSLFRADGLVFD